MFEWPRWMNAMTSSLGTLVPPMFTVTPEGGGTPASREGGGGATPSLDASRPVIPLVPPVPPPCASGAGDGFPVVVGAPAAPLVVEPPVVTPPVVTPLVVG